MVIYIPMIIQTYALKLKYQRKCKIYYFSTSARLITLLSNNTLGSTKWTNCSLQLHKLYKNMSNSNELIHGLWWRRQFTTSESVSHRFSAFWLRSSVKMCHFSGCDDLCEAEESNITIFLIALCAKYVFNIFLKKNDSNYKILP